ncbi:hypothetical protein [Fluviicola taffensis]|uniref:Uncharacterized protein n=1 Tax=Fluviicola taffensis (strain DSM 16823 / NCIMB 13979 / RW262) TaxID=755732 RepID=F2I966_FLUTR|nr:hypothetical protein [Fluviicola taffensis]AEA43013.1 hypothetical protein Fluta_1015 [Fluviicola taffensis DSM 16823]
MKKLSDVFSSFEEKVISTNSIFAGRASGGETGATGCTTYEADTAADPESWVETATECRKDSDTCDGVIAMKKLTLA